jgi:large subunit ribosomal protein L10
MSKPVKELLRKEMIKRFQRVDSIAVVGLTGVDAVSNHRLRGQLLAKDIHLMVVKNSLARQAFKEVRLERAAALLEGPCAVAYGADSIVTVVRELLALRKEVPALTVKAAYMEGTSFGLEQVEALSKYPTRQEAIARVVASMLGPGAKIAAAVLGPGGTIAALLKAIQDKQDKQESGGEAAA